MICDKCKAAISDTAKFCPQCGNKAEPKEPQENQAVKCPQCGAENPMTAKFCKKDGYNLQPISGAEEENNDLPVQVEKKDLANDTVICSACGASNPAMAKFCKKDGVSLRQTDILLKEQTVQIETVKPEPGLEKQNEVKAEKEDVQAPEEDIIKTSELLQENNTVICSTCGTKNPAASKYCKKDGTSLNPEVSNSVTKGTATNKPAKETPKNRDPLVSPSIVVGAQEKRSNKWLRIVLSAVIVITCVAAGTFYYLGYIGMNPSRVQKIINADLGSKGFSVSVTVDDKWVAKIEGMANGNNDKQAALEIVKSNKYIKDVVDNTILSQGPPVVEEIPADEKALQPFEEPKPGATQTTTIDPARLSTPSPSASPEDVRKSVNSSLKKKGLHNVYLEVNQDMTGVLKGYVYGASDKTSAMGIAKARKELKSVDDKIEIRQVPAPKTTTAANDPAKLEGDINRAIRNAGISGVHAEVKDDMSITLKGSVRSNDDKRRAMQIVNDFKQVKSVRDLIFVVGS